MRIFLTLCALTLSAVVLLTTGDHLGRMVAAVLAVIAFQELRYAWLARQARARGLALPRDVVAAGLAPHLRALRDEVRNELTRADALHDRLTPLESRHVLTAGLQAELALRDYERAHDVLSDLVARIQDAPMRPPAPRPQPVPIPRAPRSDFDEHTMPTREVA